MLNYFLFIPQFALIALYDWIYFTNNYQEYSANSWWAYAFLHATLLIEIVCVFALRHMKEMPISKKHPMWLFTIIVGVQFLLAVIFSLVRIIKLKWVIILSAIVFATEILSLVVLLIVQKHRENKESGDYDLSDEEEPEEIEQEIPTPPKKVKSTGMLLLMKFLADPNHWGVPEDFDEIDELTELISRSTQYTYEELSSIESELKKQTNALKMYIQNESMSRAKNSVLNIMDLLEEREIEINEIEENYRNSISS